MPRLLDTSSSSQWRPLLGVLVTALLVGCSSAAAQQSPRRKLGECEAKCNDPKFKDLDYFGGAELLQPAKMLQRLKAKRHDWVEQKLKKDYGADTYLAMFEPMEDVLDPVTNTTSPQRVSIGRDRFLTDPAKLPKTKAKNEEVAADGPGWGRMVRKWQMKILQIRLGILAERINVKPICLDECQASNENGSRQLKATASNGLYTKFTWATGGHRYEDC